MTSADIALIKACREADFETMKQAVENGADVNVESPEDDNYTPIMLLLESYLGEENSDSPGKVDHILAIMQYLLNHGADINHVAIQKTVFRDNKGNLTGEISEEGWSAVFDCGLYTPLEITRFAFAHGADPNVTSPDKETVLDKIDLDLWAMYDFGNSRHSSPPPCEMAIRRKILLEHGALNFRTLQKLENLKNLSEEERSLLLGCWHWDVSLLQKAWDMRPDFSGLLSDSIFSEMITNGFTFEWRNHHGNLGQLEERLIQAIAFLLDHGVSVNSGNGEALFCAVQEGLLKTVEFLLQAGAIPQSCNCSYTLMPGKPPHYFTLLEKVRSWRWRWNKATENDLFQKISEATGRWAKHPQITELAYHPSKGEKSNLTARQIADQLVRALKTGRDQNIGDVVRSDACFMMAGDEMYYNKMDFEICFRRHFRHPERSEESILQVTADGSGNSGELCISRENGRKEHFSFVCEKGMIVKAKLGISGIAGASEASFDGLDARNA